MHRWRFFCGVLKKEKERRGEIDLRSCRERDFVRGEDGGHRDVRENVLEFQDLGVLFWEC